MSQTLQSRHARQAAKGTARRPSTGWPTAAGLLALLAVPLTFGGLRLAQLAGGPAVLPDERFPELPFALVIHIVAAAVYGLGGLAQFLPRFRRRHARWHRRAGRVIAAAGLLVGLSAAWMTLVYPAQPGTGAALFVLRLVASTALVLFIGLGVTAARRRDLATHRAWMIRAYAIGVAAGTQVFTEGIGGALLGDGVVAGDLSKGAAWLLNLAVAEAVIRARGSGRAGRRR